MSLPKASSMKKFIPKLTKGKRMTWEPHRDPERTIGSHKHWKEETYMRGRGHQVMLMLVNAGCVASIYELLLGFTFGPALLWCRKALSDWTMEFLQGMFVLFCFCLSFLFYCSCSC